MSLADSTTPIPVEKKVMPKTHSMMLRCTTIGDGGERRLLAAAKHNLRETSGPHIDDAKSHMNVILAGPDDAAQIVAIAAAGRRDAGTVRKRKDATIAGEMIFSLPPNALVDTSAYFATCLAWVYSTFGEGVVMSAVAHYDENAPHLHVLMQPMRGGKWLASKVFGDRSAIKLMVDAFYREVAAGFGLQRAPEKLLINDRRALARQVLAHLRAIAAPSLQCPTWDVVRDQIEADPVQFAQHLGIPIPQRRRKTLADLKVSPGKGAKREKDESYIAVAAESRRQLSCVVVAQKDQHEPRSRNAAKPLKAEATEEAASHAGGEIGGSGRPASATGLSHCEESLGDIGDPCAALAPPAAMTADPTLARARGLLAGVAGQLRLSTPCDGSAKVLTQKQHARPTGQGRRPVRRSEVWAKPALRLGHKRNRIAGRAPPSNRLTTRR